MDCNSEVLMMDAIRCIFHSMICSGIQFWITFWIGTQNASNWRLQAFDPKVVKRQRHNSRAALISDERRNEWKRDVVSRTTRRKRKHSHLCISVKILDLE